MTTYIARRGETFDELQYTEKFYDPSTKSVFLTRIVDTTGRSFGGAFFSL
jgi:hypothetical protein